MSDLTDEYGCHKCGFMTCACLDKSTPDEKQAEKANDDEVSVIKQSCDILMREL